MRIRLARVEFFTDASRPRAATIPLGILAEQADPTARAVWATCALGLTPRQSLTISNLARMLVTPVPDFFRREVGTACRADGAPDVLEFIGSRHRWAPRVHIAVDWVVPDTADGIRMILAEHAGIWVGPDEAARWVIFQIAKLPAEDSTAPLLPPTSAAALDVEEAAISPQGGRIAAGHTRQLARLTS
jgi:hypothetical protein